MPSRKLLARWLAAMTLFALAAMLPSIASAGPGVKVSIVPPETTVTVGDDFLLRVETSSFPDLKAYSLIFQFDPVRVSLLGAIDGDVLTSSAGYTAFLRPDYAAPPDTAWYDAAVLNGSTSGPGVLVYFQFHAATEGDCPVDCRLVDFRDSQNHRTLPDCNGGLVHIIGPTPTKLTSWGRIKTLYHH